MHTRGRILVVLLLAILAIGPAPAQESRATIIGRVTDTSGTVIPGVPASYTNVERPG